MMPMTGKPQPGVWPEGWGYAAWLQYILTRWDTESPFRKSAGRICENCIA